MSPPPRRRSSMLAPVRAEPATDEAATARPAPAVAIPAVAGAPVRRAPGSLAPPARPASRFAAPRPLAPLPPEAPDPHAPPFGRSAWPPPPGSGYDAFLMWASEGSGGFLQQDVDLAIDLWAGLVPHPGTGPAPAEEPGHEPEAPSPRF